MFAEGPPTNTSSISFNILYQATTTELFDESVNSVDLIRVRRMMMTYRKKIKPLLFNSVRLTTDLFH